MFGVTSTDLNSGNTEDGSVSLGNARVRKGKSVGGRSMLSQDSIVTDLLHQLKAAPQAEERVAAAAGDHNGHSRGPSMDGFLDSIQVSSLEDLRDAVNVATNMESLIDVAEDARSMQLAGRSLGDQGLRALVGAFKEGTSRGSNLVHLDLSNNGITQRGFEALADALESGYLPALAGLILSQNNLGDAGVNMLSRVLRTGRHSSLEILHLSRCAIGEHGILSFADGLQSGNFSALRLHTLDLSANLFGEHGVVAMTRAMVMGRLPDLKVLNLSHNVLGEEGTLALAGVLSDGYVPNLTHLLLSRCYLSSEMIPIAKTIEQGCLRNLQALDVSGNYVGKNGGMMLAKALRTGYVSGLQLLNLSQCALGVQEVELITDAIEVGQIRDLQFLDLSINRFDSTQSGQNSSSSVNSLPILQDRGSFAIASLMGRGNLSRLQHLDLSQCSINDLGLVALAERMASNNLPMLQRFFFEGNEITSKRSIKALVRALESGKLPNLVEMELGQNTVGEDVTMALASALVFSTAQGPLVEALKVRLRNLHSDDSDVVGHLRKFWTNKSFRGLEILKVDETAELTPSAKVFNKYLERQYSQHLSPIVNEENAPTNRSTFFFNLVLLCAWLVAVFLTKVR